MQDTINTITNDASHLIKVENLTKKYQMGENSLYALKGVSFEVDKGEFIAIMGASGSGKSTLMNILGCLDKPSDGRYMLEDVDIKDKNEIELAYIRNQKIGFVFQSFNLIARTSSFNNVELPMIYGKIPKEERIERAKKLLIEVGLEDRINHLPNELSGGQRQRVAIARALANDPPIILADEPTGNLDTKSSLEIMQIFANLNKSGKTVIVVTHEDDIASYTHRIITFRDGRILKNEKNKNINQDFTYKSQNLDIDVAEEGQNGTVI